MQSTLSSLKGCAEKGAARPSLSLTDTVTVIIQFLLLAKLAVLCDRT